MAIKKSGIAYKRAECIFQDQSVVKKPRRDGQVSERAQGSKVTWGLLEKIPIASKRTFLI